MAAVGPVPIGVALRIDEGALALQDHWRFDFRAGLEWHNPTFHVWCFAWAEVYIAATSVARDFDGDAEAALEAGGFA
jgi:hypothetical protein